MSFTNIAWVSYECYNILGCQVVLRTTSLEIESQVQFLLRSFPRTGNGDLTPELTFSILVTPSVKSLSGRPLYLLYRDDELVGRTAESWQLFRFFEWQLDIFLADAVQDYFLLHAGAVVTTNGMGLLLPAVSGSGKSSLTMALLLQGYGYLSDELAVIDPNTGHLSAFPKPFSLKNPALFPQIARDRDIWLGPEVEAFESNGHNSYKPVWYVHAEDVRIGATVDSTVPIRYILFPKYDPESMPQLQPLVPGQAMRKLLQNSINFSLLGKGGLHLLGKLVDQAQCYNIIVNGPEATAGLVIDLLQ